MSGLASWAAGRFGPLWPQLVKTADGAVTSFLLAFGAKFAASGLDVAHITQASAWQAAGLAGLVAALSVVKSGVMIAVTGQPALGGLVSPNLRAQRNQPPVHHPVPVRPRKPAATRRRAKPRTRPPHTPPPSAEHGRHESPE